MPYLILDLEMTGSEAGYHEIIQIGAVLASDNWTHLSEFESLVYPENKENISAAAEAVHGISVEDLEDAPQSFEMLENFEKWIRKTLKRQSHISLTDIVLCGQSVINDINFLKQDYDEQNIDWPFSFKLIDLMSISYLLYQIMDNNEVKRPKSYSLNAVAQHFSLHRKEGTHNALEDAKLTYECFKKYFEFAQKLKISN